VRKTEGAGESLGEEGRAGKSPSQAEGSFLLSSD